MRADEHPGRRPAPLRAMPTGPGMTGRRGFPGRRLAAAGLALLVVLGVGGCGNPVDLVTGGDPIQDYCTALNADREPFAEMLGTDSPAALIDHLPMLQDLAGKAPDDIADDWQVFVTAVDGLADALDAAGIPASAYHDGRPPAGLDARHRNRIRAAANRLSSDPVVAAAGAISQEATDVCKINLGM